MNGTLVLMKTICIRVKLHQQACKLSRKVTNISDFQKKLMTLKIHCIIYYKCISAHTHKNMNSS